MTPTSNPQQIDLSGVWKMTNKAGDYRCACALPGDGITALHTAGLIPPPYVGRNEYDVRWICETDWILERTLDLDRTDLSLVVSQVDTIAQFELNGVPILNTENAFRHYRADLSDAAVLGQNTIRIIFNSPVTEGAARQDALPFPVPSHPGNSPIPNGNMLRKPACDFGWDWNIALAPFGIYGDITLEPNDVPMVSELRTSQVHSDGAVQVTISARLQGADAAIVRLGTQTQTVLATGLGTFDAVFDISDPDLWWPNGLGAQPLYELEIRAAERVIQRKIGLRAVQLITEPDAIGTSFKLRINGRDVFCRGANWIPADALPGRITPEATLDLLQSAKDANMNMLRVWGGGRYESDDFYETCDALGLIVWQDAMFSCNLYPSHEAFLEEVAAEVTEQAARLSNHPSVVLWCGDNELVGALGWYPESNADRDRYLVSYDRLNHAVEKAVVVGDPAALWWPSSPSLGRLNFGDGWHDDTAGDMHFWSVWHEGRDFDHYRDVAPRFCSEFGFQSYPSMDVIRSFAAPQDLNIASPVLESHQKNVGGNARIAETMFRYFRFPEGFENFVYLSQVQQGLAIKTAVSHWRASKPRCMGTLIWQLNDTWPVASWSSLDYGGGWKLMHHMARHFFAPVTTTFVPTDDSFELIAVNDGPDAAKLDVTVWAMRPSGEMRLLDQANLRVGTDAGETVLSIRRDVVRDTEILVMRTTLPDGQEIYDHHAPRPYKAYDLVAPDLKLEQTDHADHTELVLTAKRPAFFVALEPNQPGRLSDNAVLVLPDAPTRLRFVPKDRSLPRAFTLRDLHSATYGTEEKDP